jgi:DNA-binding PucR family transcriptional regulator
VKIVGDPGALVSWVAQQMRVRRDDFIAGLMSTTRSEIRPLDHDARMVDLLNASVTENVVAAIHFLEHGGAESDVEAPTAALVYARALAQRDVPLSALIRAYRIGHGRFVDEAMAVLATRATPEQSLPAAMELVRRAALWIDRVCDQVGVVYERERDRWVSSRSGLRQHWVNEVLTGAAVDIGRAEDLLEYRFDRRHVAAVMWPDDSVATREVVEVFDKARSVIGRRLSALGPSLMVPTDEREARLWWPVGDDELDLEPLIRAVSEADLPVRVAMGDAGQGVDGFHRTLRQAEQAKVVAVAGGPASGQLVLYGQVAPVALMTTEADELRRFVHRVLRDLAVDAERNVWLRETLREFLARNRSFAATAEALYVHRNTIQYRVNHAMELCGASFDDPEVILQIQIALLACRWMGRSVLKAPSR